MKNVVTRIAVISALVAGLCAGTPLAFAQDLVLTQRAVVVNVGTSATVTVSNLNTGQTISSTATNSGIASATQNGNQVTVAGISPGTTTLSLCSNDSTQACVSLYVTVEPAGNGQLSFSKENLYVAASNVTQVTIGGSNGSYTLTNSTNSAAAYTSISGNILSVTAGSAAGTTWLTICSADGKTCGVLFVSGQGGGSPIAGSTPTPTPAAQVASVSGGPQFSPASVTVGVGQSATVNVTGGGSYYILSNTNSNVAVVSVSGATATVYGEATGNATSLICQAGGLCTSLPVTVGAQVVAPVATPAVTPAAIPAAVVSSPVSASAGFYFTSYLKLGSESEEVVALQKILAAEGYFSGTASGYYGAQTEKAVKAYQAANGLTQLGVVGPGTRALLNQGTSGGSVAGASTPTASAPSSSISTASLAELRAQVLSLQTQIAQILVLISKLSAQ